MKASYG